MNLQSLIAAILISFCFAVWPVVSKYSGAQGAWVGVIVAVGSASATFILSFLSRQITTLQSPSIKAIVILVTAGVLNGIAFYFYSLKIADPKISTAAFMTIVAILMIVMASILDWALNGVIPDTQKTFGYCFAATAVYLLIK